MIYYSDEKIKIRDIEENDVINLFSWSIDKELNQFDPRPLTNTSSELVQECIAYCNRFKNEVINKNTAERKYKYFIITNSEGKTIGAVNFFSIDNKKKQGEMGIEIGDKRYWRKGIAYTAVQVVVNYIFENMDINRIYIETTEANKPTINLFEKLKFKYCGQHIEDDGFKFIVMERNR